MLVYISSIIYWISWLLYLNLAWSRWSIIRQTEFSIEGLNQVYILIIYNDAFLRWKKWIQLKNFSINVNIRIFLHLSLHQFIYFIQFKRTGIIWIILIFFFYIPVGWTMYLTPNWCNIIESIFFTTTSWHDDSISVFLHTGRTHVRLTPCKFCPFHLLVSRSKSKWRNKRSVWDRNNPDSEKISNSRINWRTLEDGKEVLLG